LRFLALNGANSLNAHGTFDPWVWRRLAQILRAEEIELVHALTPKTALSAAIAGRLAGIATLASIYEIEVPPKGNVIKVVCARIMQAVLKWGIDRVIVPSDLMRQNLWQMRYPRARSEVIYPGVEVRDPDAPVPDRVSLGLPSGPLVTLVAALVEDQGFNALMDSVPRLLVRVPEAEIAVVGSGPLLLKSQQHARKLPIHWLGERADVRDIIAASDVIVVHPRYDSLPRAVLEAAAAGKPIIASRVAGIGEIVEPGTTGTLVTYDDARDLAIQMSRYLLQPAFRRNVGAAAQDRARRRFSLDVQREAMTTLYEGTIYARR